MAILSRDRCWRPWRVLSRAEQARVRALSMEELRLLDRWYPQDTAEWQTTYQRLLDLKATSGLDVARAQEGWPC